MKNRNNKQHIFKTIFKHEKANFGNSLRAQMIAAILKDVSNFKVTILKIYKVQAIGTLCSNSAYRSTLFQYLYSTIK